MINLKTTKSNLEELVPMSDSPRGHLYQLKCAVQAKWGLDWEPKEPNDDLARLYRLIIDTVSSIVRDGTADDLVKRIYAVISSKGGVGKTPVITTLAVLFKAATQVNTLFADFNHENGTAGDRLGIHGVSEETKILSDVLLDPGSVSSHDETAGLFPRHPETSMEIMLSNNGSIQGVYDELGLGSPTVLQTMKAIKVLKKTCHSMFIDTGNGDAGPICEGVVFEADALVFPIIADKSDHIGPLLSTLAAYAKLGHQAKVQAAPKVVCAATKGTTAEEYLIRIRGKVAEDLKADEDKVSILASLEVCQKADSFEGKIDAAMEYLGLTIDRIYVIPFSKYIHQNGVASALRRNTGMPTLIAAARVLRHMVTVQVPSPEEKRAYNEEVLQRRSIANGTAIREAQNRQMVVKELESLTAAVQAAVQGGDDPRAALAQHGARLVQRTREPQLT